MDIIMTDDTFLSGLRSVLCSQSNAIRVAARMRDDGVAAHVVGTGNPLQPWLTVEHTGADQRQRECA